MSDITCVFMYKFMCALTGKSFPRIPFIKKTKKPTD